MQIFLLYTFGRRVEIFIRDQFMDSLSSQYSCLHCTVRTLDLGHVHEAWTTAHQTTTRERQLRDTLTTADSYNNSTLIWLLHTLTVADIYKESVFKMVTF